MMRSRVCLSATRATAFVATVAFVFGSSLFAQSASIGGTVVADPSEKPLANAEIQISGLNRLTRSDSAGNFTFTGLPAGKHVIVIRLVGYEASSTMINLSATEKFDADFMIKPTTTTLEKFDVKAKAKVDNGIWTTQLREFEERRETGLGTFITKEQFEKEDGRAPSSILASKVPGLKVIRVNGQSFLASTRGSGLSGLKSARSGLYRLPPACYMQVVINGIVRWNGSGSDLFNVDVLDSLEIIGMEFYSTASTPVQYNGTRGDGAGSCGTVLIWTKGAA